MKVSLTPKAISLSLLMFLGLSTIAQRSDGFFRNNEDTYDNRDAISIWAATNGIQNDDFGESPLGSGLLILTAAGAGYAISRRHRSRKNASNASKTALLLAIAILLGISSCKKKTVEPIAPSGGNQVAITLNVGGGSKVEVDPPHVNFETGDEIIVVSNNHYVGTLTATKDGENVTFSGNVTDPTEGQPLYFYFLGNKQGSLTVGDGSCTVNISDQTNYPHLPVISMAPSDQNYPSDGNNYTAHLHNKCALMKFSVTTPANSPICITGMNNKVIIDFSKATNDAQNNGFTYDKEDGGIIKMKGGSGTNVEKWAIVFPQSELAAGSAGSIYAQNGTYITFNGSRPTIHAINVNGYYHEGDDVITMTVNTATDVIDLGDITANTTIATGKTVIGTLANNVQISIAAGATVTLSGVNINGSGTWTSGKYAGINCFGDATIILADGTTNTVKGFRQDYPGIHVPSGYTLTINGVTAGTGSLNASSNGYGAGIGGGQFISCGHITINGGTIIAYGGSHCAGIGGGDRSSCGDITISGGTVTATGGQKAAGIGSGGNYGGTGSASCGSISITGGTVVANGGNFGAGIGGGDRSSCGDITIANTVTRVTATKGGSAPNSIGAGYDSSCGTVTIGGVVGAISTSPYTFEGGALSGKFTINAGGDQVYFSQGNLQATYDGSSWSWAFAANQWDYIGDAAGNTSINGNGTVSANNVTVDLFGWVGASSTWEGAAQYGISNSTATNNTDGYGNVNDEALKSDWGNTIGTGWRTLTKDEWQYVFNTRSGATSVNGTANARYTHATINTDGTGVNGMILFPDGVTIANGEATSWGTINGNSAWGTQCTSAEWTALAAKGCVFLPAAGYRSQATVYDVGSVGGRYWSSSLRTSNVYNAYNVYFVSGSLYPASYNGRALGCSVRLVMDAE